MVKAIIDYHQPPESLISFVIPRQLCPAHAG